MLQLLQHFLLVRRNKTALKKEYKIVQRIIGNGWKKW